MLTRLLDILSTQFVRISGPSMEPTLSHRSWIRVNRRAYRSALPQRFDVVRLEDPGRAGHWIVKRVVGLPGEEVRLEDGLLFVDGVETPETHTNGTVSTGKHEWWPRSYEVVILGDNRENSTDSRKFGTVSLSAIRGRVIL